jgi:hypothetical protein
METFIFGKGRSGLFAVLHRGFVRRLPGWRRSMRRIGAGLHILAVAEKTDDGDRPTGMRAGDGRLLDRK